MFPEDEKISAMSLLTERVRCQQVLRKLLNDTHLTIQPAPYNGCWSQILSYRPERYCLFQFTVTLKNGQQKELVARLFGSTESAENHWNLAQALWSENRHGSQSHNSAVIPIGYDAKLAVCLMEKVPGRSLSEFLVNN